MPSPLSKPSAALPLFSWSRILRLLPLTVIVLFLSGYHPFADDADIYVAGIRRLLDPTLYPADAAFVLAHTHLSIFAHGMAAFVRLSYIPLPWVLLAAHLASIFLFLLACFQLASRLFATPAQRFGAVIMAAACFTLPVAGTALVLMDPYVTARSFSTPCGLFAVAACLDCAWLRMACFAALAALLHPLMAAFLIAFLILQVLVQAGRMSLAALVAIGGVAAFAAAFFLALGVSHHAPTSAAWRQATLLPSHTYLLLARWRWYEILGLVLPLLLFAWAAWRFRRSAAIGGLSISCLLTGSASLIVAALFVPASGPYLLAPLQPLRSFHLIYALGVLLLGGAAGWLIPHTRWAALCFLIPAIALSLGQHQTYGSSNFVEWPFTAPSSPWQQAFLWIGGHTPHDAVFAFNPRLVYLPGEDAQGFRAITGRDHLADDKDGGVVVVFPHLAARWAQERAAQTGIDLMSDAERLPKLRSHGVTWLLLAPGAVTSFPCPYKNAAVAVCELPH
ncbi:hypothetical protein [Paracidobacterium acidisoli]|uniref:Glycosyltransferase RgtA/B/C/D-like domain-containing protein n=1 Tax=Paracidobacterium acidisoli TaxID=2303751 RepID=A0A372IMT0_9BACT|nr:hypothetical protein [Paracidobacterium acidisoli]MBT9331925.1 hypothetical protein [Paracidobacterium acidisoli]